MPRAPKSDDRHMDLAARTGETTGGVFATPLAAAGLLIAGGPDARDFLHGQLANDVRGLSVGSQCVSLLLNHKGHALADVSVLRRAADLLLVIDDGASEVVEESLRRHIVFDDVTLTRAGGALITVQGERAAEALKAAAISVPEADGQWVAPAAADTPQGAGWHVFHRRRSRAGGFDLVFQAAGGAAPELGGPSAAVAEAVDSALSALRAAGVTLADAAMLDAARVDALVAAAAFEGGEGVLPQEAALATRLSYRKGCYLGQEIMARIEARGNLKRALARLDLSAPVPVEASRSAPGSPVALDGRTVGRLGTVVRSQDGSARALAVLRRDVPEGAVLEALGTRAQVSAWAAE